MDFEDTHLLILFDFLWVEFSLEPCVWVFDGGFVLFMIKILCVLYS